MKFLHLALLRRFTTSAVTAAFALGSALALAQQGGAPPANTLTLPGTANQGGANRAPLKAPIPQPETSLEVPSLKLRGQPGFDQVTVTVTDSNGKYVTDLKEDDFRVFEDGQQRPIDFFRVDRSAPVSVGIIVDSSSSMATKFFAARAAITRFVDNLDPNDDLFLESFSVEAELLQPFTLDHKKIVKHLDFLHAMTQTALYDAVYLGLLAVERGHRDKKALLVVTDGMDNRSEIRRERVVALARAIKVLVYSIGIGDESTRHGDDSFMGGLFKSDEDLVDVQTLTALSEETGAKTFILPRVGGGAAMIRDCEAISNELRQQYSIAYLSPDPGRPGYRTLRIDIPKHPELSVRVRKGVSVKPP